MNKGYRGLLLVFVVMGMISWQVALAEGGVVTKTFFYKDKDGKEITCPSDATTEPCVGIVKFLKEKTESNESYGDSQCFDDYRFNSVEADLAPTHDHAVSGVPIEFSGTITNQNPYPVFDATVYIKMFKTGNTGEVFMSQGDDLVDQFVALKNISLPANASKSISYTYHLPRYSGAGTYRITTSVILNNQFNMSGLPFLDDITGPSHSFTVDSDTTAVMWDKNAVTLNGQHHEFAKPSPVFGKDEKVTVSGMLRNPSTDTHAVDVTASVYTWDSLKEEYFVEDVSVGSYSLSGKASQAVTFEVPNLDHTVTYVILEASDHDTKSLLDIRLARSGIEWPRINFATLTSYPFESGKEVSYMACIYNLGGGTIDNVKVEQVVTDADTGKVLAERTYTGPFSGIMGGVKASFTPEAASKRVDLTTRTSYNGQVYDEAVVHYDCSLLGSDACPQKGIISSSKSSAEKVLWITGIVLLCLVGGYWLRRRFSSHALVVTLSLLSAFFIASPVLAGAEDKGSTETFDMIVGDGNHIWGSIFYHTWISEKSGNTVPQGADIIFDSNWPNSDIQWAGTGKYVGGPGSPYGFWVTNLSDLRDDQAVVVNSRNDIRWDPTAPTVVGHTFPTISAQGSGAITCSGGNSCLATGTGYGKVTVHHSGGRLRVRQIYTYCDDFGNCTDTGVNYDSTMEEQTHVFDNYTVTATNEAPNAPSITGPDSFLEDSAQNFSFRATDPDSDTIRYGVDWDNNGSVDEYAPTSGYVSSGTTRTASHAWVTPGVYTFKARTEDSKSGVSTWTSKTVTVTSGPSVIMTGRAGDKMGYDPSSLWGRIVGFFREMLPTVQASGSDVNIIPGQNVNLTWTSGNVASCNLTVPPAAPRNVGTSATDTPISGITNSLTITITCIGTNGEEVNDTVNVVVNVAAALNICPTSATINEGGYTQLAAWYTPTGTTFNGCAAPNGTNQSGSASWSSSNSGVASVSTGRVTGVTPGNASIGATYSGVSDTTPTSVTVLCTPKDSCSSQSSQDKADLVCTTDTFTIPDGCGNNIVCNGARSCDYNWKEVAP